jgi:hypothetical protein
MEIRSAVLEFFHADRRTDVVKLMGAFLTKMSAGGIIPAVCLHEVHKVRA